MAHLHRSFAVGTAVVALVLAGGITTAFAAEQSLPGDALYPVKTGVTEPIRGFFAFGHARKAEWRLKMLERRMDESERSTHDHAMTPEHLAAVQEQFAEHSAKLTDRLEKLRAQGLSDVADRMEERFATMQQFHDMLFTDLADDNKLTDETRERMHDLMETMHAQHPRGPFFDRSNPRGKQLPDPATPEKSE